MAPAHTSRAGARRPVCFPGANQGVRWRTWWHDLDSRPGQSPSWALPISLFSIPLGLAGLGGAWTAAANLLGAPSWPATVSFAAASAVFVAFTVSYVTGTFRPGAGFHIDLRHPLLGPLTAYLPVIAILLIAHYASALGGVAKWLIWFAVACLALNAAA